MTALPIVADIHCSAIMEHVCYEELNARVNLVTNGGVGIGPIEAGKLNDQMWAFGTLLQERRQRHGAGRARRRLHALQGR